MKYAAVTFIFLVAVLFHPKAAAGVAWLYWLARLLVVLWAVWLQKRILEKGRYD